MGTSPLEKNLRSNVVTRCPGQAASESWGKFNLTHNMLYCTGLTEWDESQYAVHTLQDSTSYKPSAVVLLLYRTVRTYAILWTFHFAVAYSLKGIKTGTKAGFWQALACEWLSALCKRDKQAVRLLTCRKSPICSISSLKCSIFLLMVKLGSVELYSWRLPLVKAGMINKVLHSEFQVTHSEIQRKA